MLQFLVVAWLFGVTIYRTGALLQTQSSASRAHYHNTQWSLSAKTGFDASKFTQSIIGEEIPISSDVTELPNTFQDAVGRSASRSMACIASGQMRVRIDFDTSIGDMTYTSLKNTLPMIKEFSAILSKEMGLSMSMPETAVAVTDEATNTAATTSTTATVETAAAATPTAETETDEPERTMRIFFPDMGAAALARRDWKLGTEVSEVPPCVRTANMQNDPLEPTDKVAVLLCPQSSETDFVKRIMESCTEAKIPLIMINPNLVNMDQGFGVRKLPFPLLFPTLLDST
jgi:hypothetical protein